MPNQEVQVPGAPEVPGLVFRRLCGREDFVGMAAAISAGADADGVERVGTPEDLEVTYTHLHHCDIEKDLILVELSGKIVGYARVVWDEELSTGNLLGTLIAFMAPEARGKGVGRAILRWQEDRLREVLASAGEGKTRYFEAFCSDDEVARAHLLLRSGYHPVRYAHEMVRPSLDGIPDFGLPAEFETRAVKPEDYRPIWDAWQAALVDHWGYTAPCEADYQAWVADTRYFQPGLWQVAWERSSGRVAGGVLGFIDREENARYGRARGYTECISVGREWRRRGVARALIAASLRAQKDLGMTESALGVDSENLTGATRVYADCGFVTRKTTTIYRKAF